MFPKKKRKATTTTSSDVITAAPRPVAATIEGPRGIIYTDPEITAAAARAGTDMIDLRTTDVRDQRDVEAEAQLVLAARRQIMAQGPGGVVYTDPDEGAPSPRGVYGPGGFTPEAAVVPTRPKARRRRRRARR